MDIGLPALDWNDAAAAARSRVTVGAPSRARNAGRVSEPFAGVELCRDVTPADWLRSALRPWDRGRTPRIASFVPATYPAHARVLHRAWRGDRPVRGSESAGGTGPWRCAGPRSHRP